MYRKTLLMVSAWPIMQSAFICLREGEDEGQEQDVREKPVCRNFKTTAVRYAGLTN